jgi:hypothetical protein
MLNFSRHVDDVAFTVRMSTMRGDAEEALRTLDLLTPEDRRTTQIVTVEAIARSSLGDFDGAKRVIESAVGNDLNLDLARAFVAMSQSKFSEAADLFRKVSAAAATSGQNVEKPRRSQPHTNAPTVCRRPP